MDRSLSTSPLSSDPQVDDLLSQISDETIIKLNLHPLVHGQPPSFTNFQPPSAEFEALPSDLASRLAKLKAPSIPAQRRKEKDPGPAMRVKQEIAEKDTKLQQGLRDSEKLEALDANVAARWAALKAASNCFSDKGAPNRPHAGENAAPLPSHCSLPFGSSITSSSCSDSFMPDPSGIEGRHVPMKHTHKGNKRVDQIMDSAISDIQALLASSKDQVNLERRQLKQSKKLNNDSTLVHKVDDSEEEISDAEVDQVVQWAKDAARVDVSESEDEEFALKETVLEQGLILPSIKDDIPDRKKGKRWKLW